MTTFAASRSRRTIATAAVCAVAGGMFLPMINAPAAHAERVDLTSKYGYTDTNGNFSILGGYDKPKAMKGDTDLAFCVEMGVYFPSSTNKVVKQVETDEYPEVAYVINKWGDKKDNKNQAAVQYLVHKNLDVHDDGFKSDYGIKPGDSGLSNADYQKARQKMLDGVDPSVKKLADTYWAEAEKNVGPYTAGTPKITPDAKNSGTGTITGFSLKNAKGTSLSDQKITVKISGDATFADGKKSKTTTVAAAAKGLAYSMTKSSGDFKVSYSTDDLPSAKLVIAQLKPHDGGDGYDGTGVYPKGNPAAGEHKTDRTGKPVQTSISALATEKAAVSKEATYGQDSMLKTTATDKADGDKNVAQSGGTVVDTVNYSGLIGGKEYTMSGELMDKATGKSTGVKATKKFTADASGTGTVKLEFALPDSVKGKTLVAFETAEDNNGDVVVHTDINDEAQTVYISSLSSNISDDADGDQYLAQAGGTVTDTVPYSNLKVGAEHKIVTELLDRETGKSTGITQEATFTPKEADGEQKVQIKIPSGYAGKTLLAVQSIYQGDTEVASDRYIADEKDGNEAREAETIYVSDLSTTAVDAEDGDKNLVQSGGTITDTVKYENLSPGKKYTVSGELMDKETGKSTGLTAKATFTPKKSDGTVDVVFKDLPDSVAGKTLVAFETVTTAGAEGEKPTVVAEHKDIKDKDQTVVVANIGTTATDKLDGDKSVQQTGGTVVDTVKYENLVPGTKYTVEGTLMDKETGKALVDADGKEITSEATFTPEKASGSVDLEFELPDDAKGKTLVAFEKVSNDVGIVATHEDIDDEGQTVGVVDLGTTAKDAEDGDKRVDHDGTIVDTVKYENLTPGKKYVVTGELMDQETGEAVKDSDGKAITATQEFTPKKADGSVDVTFDLDSVPNTTVVVFETLKDENGNVQAEHKDLDDRGQTVVTGSVPPAKGEKGDKGDTGGSETTTPPMNTGASVHTGGLADTGMNPGLLALGGLGAAAILTGSAASVYRVRKNRLEAVSDADVED